MHTCTRLRLPLDLFSVVILLAFLHLASSDSQCHVCDNYYTLNKAFKDRKSNCEEFEDRKGMNGSRESCSGYRFNGCMKMVTKSWKSSITGAPRLIATVVTRECATVPPGYGIGCTHMSGAYTTKTICYCNTPFCNRGDFIKSKWQYLLLSVVSAAWFLIKG